MAGTPDKKLIVKEVLGEYFRELYFKRLRGERLTEAEVASVKNQEALCDYVFTQDKVKIVETNVHGGKKGYKNREPYEISRPWVKKTIKGLIDDHIIEKRDGIFEYVPSVEEQSAAHPILKIAADIPVVPLNVTNLTFYRVPDQYADSISRYINTQFYGDDIYALPIGDVVMCMNLQIPENAEAVKKKKSLDSRVREVLKHFDIQETKRFDEEQGYTEEQLQEKRRKRAAESARVSYEEILQQEADYGRPLQLLKMRKERRDKEKAAEQN